jgi:hypothetical protein
MKQRGQTIFEEAYLCKKRKNDRPKAINLVDKRKTKKI